VANATVVLKMCYLAKRAVFFIFLLTPPITLLDAAEFWCPADDVTCLIAAINEANAMPGEHTINLEPGSYTLQTVDNGLNGLPVISGSIRIQATAEDVPTTIERDVNAPSFRIFEISAAGELTLVGLVIQRGSAPVLGAAIRNSGVTSLQDSLVRDSRTNARGAISNVGTLFVIRTIIADNDGGHEGGGIYNEGDAIVENSSIVRNGSADGGGILNHGSLIVKNSAIIFNSTDCCNPGGGILNLGGSVEIVNSTIAENVAGGAFGNGGGGIANIGGDLSVTNSTIRENQVLFSFARRGGGGIDNDGGTLRLQNTILAGNTIAGPIATGPDCVGTITSLGNNLVGDPIGCEINLQLNDLTGDPGLGPLVEIGEDDSPGKAFYPILAGSVVIDSANPTACPKQDQLGNPRVGICDIGAVEFQGRRLVSVDIRPRSDANRINPNSSQNINVAVFSGKGFNATTLDPNTIRFGATGTEAAPVHLGRRDVNRDGRRDLVVRFQIPDTGISCGDSSATLTGNVSTGAAIIGSSPIRTVQCRVSQR
jgi:hypothetical protein